VQFGPYCRIAEEGDKLGITKRIAKRHNTLDSYQPGMDLARLVVPDRVREAIESAWPEAEFWDVRLVNRRSDTSYTILDWSEVLQRWWHVASSIELPHVSPTTHLHSPMHGRLPPGSLTPGFVYEDDIDGVQWIRYRRSDLESVGPFGLALGMEREHPSEYDRYLICSRKFHDWAKELGLDFDYIPVGIDEE